MTNPSADPAPILDLIEAFRRSKVLFTSVRLGVFDHLEGDPQPASRLAPRLNVNDSALTRLLDGCVALGLLYADGNGYGNAPLASRFLVSASPDTLAGYITYSDQSLYPLWGNLADAIREGTNRWDQTFGSREALFANFFRDDAATASFLSAMHGFGRLSSPKVVTAFDLSRFTHLVDLGGATGHLAIAACEAYPNLRATVLDLARVQPFAEQHISRSSVADRIGFTVGDFFSGELPHGDLYVLGRILHDWAESQINLLLRKIGEALPSGGGLLIAETLFHDDRHGSVYTAMQDLNMLICTDGRERTAAEYRTLLQDAGFGQVEGRRTGLLVDATLAIKP